MSKPADKCRCLVLTTNVGSVFEVESIVPGWGKMVRGKIEESGADFVVMAMQEIGGKDSAYMGTLDAFLKAVHDDVAEELGYVHSGVIFQHGNDTPNFTAMACTFFVRKELVGNRFADAASDGVAVDYWDFARGEYVPFEEMIVRAPEKGVDAAAQSYAEHAKFSQWPKSRKGYMHTKWRVGNAKRSHELSMCNIHLFHDDINTTAIAETPSVYAKKRAGGLAEAMTTCTLADTSILFGDFNIRLDAREWVAWAEKKFAGRFAAEPDTDGKKMLDIHEKDLSFHYLQECFNDETYREEQLELDNEIARFNEESASKRADGSALKRMHLHELDVNFAATYCLLEHHAPLHKNCQYNSKRIPAWCDRIVFTDAAKELMQSPEYGAVHHDDSTGDHLPVYLTFDLDL